MRFLILSGPNLNMLGLREPELYGSGTYSDLIAFVRSVCSTRGIDADFFQSNHEGALIDALQESMGKYDGIVFNPAGYTHTSVAIGDAVKYMTCPVVEVHLTDVSSREDFRKISYIREACIGCVFGEGFNGYEKAVDMLLKELK